MYERQVGVQTFLWRGRALRTWQDLPIVHTIGFAAKLPDASRNISMHERRCEHLGCGITRQRIASYLMLYDERLATRVRATLTGQPALVEQTVLGGLAQNHHSSTKEDLIMTAMDIGKELVALCRQGKSMDAIAQLYSPGIESVEAMANPHIGQVQKGIEAVKRKNQWWVENHQIHNVEMNGPFPNGDQFIIHFTYEVTPKQTGQRMTMSEMGLYTVQQGKITKEVFFYTM